MRSAEAANRACVASACVFSDKRQSLLSRADSASGALLGDQHEQPADLRPWRQAQLVAAEERPAGRAIREAAGGAGLDVVLEAAGDQAAVDAAVDAVRPGARIVLVGIPSEPRTSFHAATARRKGLTFAVARRAGHVYPRAVHLAASGRVDVRSMVTHRFPLRDVAAAFETAVRRTGHKVIVEA
jgi:L-iditol 2-dehydrogenase